MGTSPDGRQQADSDAVFPCYALAVQMADRVSARRGGANMFFLSIQTTLLTAVGLADTTLRHVAWYVAVCVAVAGCAVSVVWWVQLRSYRLLNHAKFEVVHALEEELPARPFTDEWKWLNAQPRSWRHRYIELGTTEQLVPAVFVVLHIVLLVGRLVS